MKGEGREAGRHIHFVNPGEHFVTAEDALIETITGRCLTVCLFEKEKKIGAMAAFVVAGSIQGSITAEDESSARGISTMELLMADIIKLGGDRRRVEASVLGGVMSGADKPLAGIILNSVKFIRQYLAIEKIPVLRDDLKSDIRMRARFSAASGVLESEEAGEDALADFRNLERSYLNRVLSEGSPYGKVMFFDSSEYETLINLIPDIVYRIDHKGVFTYLSDSIFKLGYEPDDLIGVHFSRLVHPDDLLLVQRSSALPTLSGQSTGHGNAPKLFDERRTGKRITKNLKVRLVPKSMSGSDEYPLGEIIATGHYEVEEDGKKFSGTIGLIRDVTEVVSTQRALKQTETFYRNLINGSSDVFSMVSVDGTFMYMSNSILRMTGCQPGDMIGESIYAHTHDEDRVGIEDLLSPQSTSYQGNNLVEHRFKGVGGEWIVLESTLYKILDYEKQAILVILHSRDITGRKEAEKRLRAALREKEVLLKEIHHRVKNNLQIITSLLNLQTNRVENQEVRIHLRESQNRIRAIALIHEKLYQSEDLANVNFEEYIRTITGELFKIYNVDASRVSAEVRVNNIMLPIDKAIPCGLLANELVTNSLKYAFPPELSREGKVSIVMEPSGDTIRMTVSDNGVGIPDDIDLESAQSLGLVLVRILTRDQLHGEVTVSRKGGTSVSVVFCIN